MPSESELRDGAGFVRYEFQMLTKAAEIWKAKNLGTYSKSNKWERRRTTDVFLLHARNLLDFFAPRKSAREADVEAKHYDPSWECSEGSSLAGRTIVQWRDQIDKLLSHVTYNRTTMINENTSASRWPIESLNKELVAMLDGFLMALPESRREWFG